MKKILLVLLCSVLSVACLDGQSIPKRLVSDTRRINHFSYPSPQAIAQINAIWASAVADTVEQGGCVFGHLLNDSMITVDSVLPPTDTSMQSDTTIAFSCSENKSGYIGRFHTHLGGWPLPSEVDRASQGTTTDDAFWFIMAHPPDSRTRVLTIISKENRIAILPWLWGN